MEEEFDDSANTAGAPGQAPDLPAEIWAEILHWLNEAETLATLADVSQGMRGQIKAQQGVRLVFTTDDMAESLQDATAKYIILMRTGLAVTQAPVNPQAKVFTRRANTHVSGTGVLCLVGPTASATVTGGQAYVYDQATITTVTGGQASASDRTSITTVTGGEASATDQATITTVTGGQASASDRASITTVTGGMVRAYANATITTVTSGQATTRGRATITAVTGGEVYAYNNATVVTDGATVIPQEGFTGTITGTASPFTSPSDEASLDFEQDFTEDGSQ